MSHGSARAGVAFEDMKNEVIDQLDEVASESDLVYRELVLPNWGSSDRHGFPRTLYGYVMVSFSFIDLLSQYRYDVPSQTTRMENLFVDYMAASHDAAVVVVKLWRHTLMHTGNPQKLVEQSSRKRYRWLLHWREHLPRDQHMQFQRPSAGEEILNVGLLYLVDDLQSAAQRLLADVGASVQLRAHALRIHTDVSEQRL